VQPFHTFCRTPAFSLFFLDPHSRGRNRAFFTYAFFNFLVHFFPRDVFVPFAVGSKKFPLCSLQQTRLIFFTVLTPKSLSLFPRPVPPPYLLRPTASTFPFCSFPRNSLQAFPPSDAGAQCLLLFSFPPFPRCVYGGHHLSFFSRPSDFLSVLFHMKSLPFFGVSQIQPQINIRFPDPSTCPPPPSSRGSHHPHDDLIRPYAGSPAQGPFPGSP